MTAWEDRHGSDRVVHFGTRRGKLVNTALDRWEEEWAVGLNSPDGSLPWSHDGSPELAKQMADVVVAERGGSSPYRMLTTVSEADMIEAAEAAIFGFGLVADARVKAAELMRPRSAGIL